MGDRGADFCAEKGRDFWEKKKEMNGPAIGDKG